MEPEIIVLDTETTGLKNIGVVEVAWARIDNEFNIVDEFESMLNPGRPLNPIAAGTNGIRDEDLVDAPLIDSLPWPTGPVIVVAHNVKFDIKLVQNYMEVHGILCTLQLARRMLTAAMKADPVFEGETNFSLQTLAAWLGFERQIAHRALGDVKTCLDLLRYLADGANMTVTDLVEYSQKPVLLDSISFGKHAGTPINLLPKSYVSWLRTQDLDIDMAYTIKKYWG
jgi:DNA polymerase III epsilon subunit-like protein